MIPNRVLTLLKFRDASDAEEFHKLFNGQPYSSMDLTQICQVVYVTSITISSSASVPSRAFAGHSANWDPWPVVRNEQPLSTGDPSHSNSSTSNADGNGATRARGMSSAAAALAQSLIHELPTCPVCLERMDASVTGLMTITCQHTFHCSCLSKWGDSRWVRGCGDFAMVLRPARGTYYSRLSLA